MHFIRPGVAFAVNKLSQFINRPNDEHWLAEKRVLQYLASTRDRGIFLRSNNNPSLHAFFDAAWGGNKDAYTSTNSNIVYLGSPRVSWCLKKQKSATRSSTEAEYQTVTDTVSDLRWISLFLQELGIQSSSQPVNLGPTCAQIMCFIQG